MHGQTRGKCDAARLGSGNPARTRNITQGSQQSSGRHRAVQRIRDSTQSTYKRRTPERPRRRALQRAGGSKLALTVYITDGHVSRRAAPRRHAALNRVSRRVYSTTLTNARKCQCI